MKLLFAVVRPASLAVLVATLAVSTSPAQQPTPPRPATPANGDRPTRRPATFDQARAESLYLSTDPVDHPPRDFDDVMAAYDYLKTLPYVDPDRVGIMGWEPRRFHHSASRYGCVVGNRE
jgi:hypothetical protein